MKKIILITGANSGIGKAAALSMAKSGHHIVMLCRSKKRGDEAQQEIITKSGNNGVDLMLCNLASLTSIKKFATDFIKKYDRLDVFISNAGLILTRREVTSEGQEMQFAVNHLAPFLLTHLLLPLLKKSKPARVIIVASGAHKGGKIYFDNLTLKDNYATFRAYAQSKLANILFTYELARRVNPSEVTVNCLHPGAVATQIGVDRNTGFGKTIMKIARLVLRTPEKGARTTVYLATSDEVKDTHGKYFYDCKEISSSKQTYNKELAAKLWDISTKLCAIEDSL